ncbi:hypothetical protein DID88_010416 [Monilinia fructigena]|uniref:RNase H type-1 domain-containing protein n=1 Tax=Monilinia fructigena TaxID=38457 RepID=A0A395ILC3_9HELO|nr:hypothetical protein DID88_010416 [Monilinia fructigena]
MQVYNIRIKWSPGHTEIEGNEAADRLADTGAHTPDCDPGPASLPTISGIGSIFCDLRSGAQQSWWIKRKAKLSAHYLKWDLTYRVGLPRSWTSLGTNYTGSSPSALLMGILPGTITNSGMRMLLQNAPAVLPKPLCT